MDSEFRNFIFDSDSIKAFDVEDVAGEEVKGDDYARLHEEAVAAQRLGVARNATEYMKGSAALATFDTARPMTDEKMFRVSGLIDWVSADPDMIVSQMRVGRVRARVSAGMGVGKSTKLPFYIAREMNHRVMYVSLDVGAVHQNDQFVRQTGIGAIKTQWKSRPTELVCAMTYHDFNAYASLTGRATLFKSFETFIFDEASMVCPAVRAALKQFAVLALPDTNLLMCSANIREDAKGTEMESGAVGNVRVLERTLTPDQAIASGKLVSDQLVDRTLVVLPSDERVEDMRKYYESQGVDVRAIDSATHKSESAMVSEWLRGDSSTPRVLVAHCRYAIMYNFPVAYVIVFPWVSKLVVKKDHAYYEEVFMTQAMVNQAVSRVGRGIVSSGSALVTSSERGVGELTDSEKFEEFVLLTKSYIRPRQTPEWENVNKQFPNGLSPAVAQLVCKVNLPPELVFRYLAADGRIAAKYAKAMMVFSQLDHYIYPSKHELPMHYNDWVQEDLYGALNANKKVLVPMRTVGELQIVVQAISAMSEGKFDIVKWRLNNNAEGRDLDSSDSEGSAIMGKTVRRLRKVRSIERVVVQPQSVPEIEGWSFENSVADLNLGDARTRSAIMVGDGRRKEALRNMFALVNNYTELSPMTGLSHFMEKENEIELPSGEVESPGGTIICELSHTLMNQLNNGTMLDITTMKELVSLFRVHGNSIAISRVFDCLGKPWSSVMTAFSNDFVIGSLVTSGLSTFAYDLLGCLANRFAYELVTTVTKSNVYKTRVLGLFRVAPNVRDIVKAMKKGRFSGIAQSERYIKRVLQIKQWSDDALLVAERNGNYLPAQVTDAQNMLPIHPRTGVGNLSDGSMVPSHNYAVMGHHRKKRSSASSRNFDDFF